jgi:hypothetical protein
VTSPAGRVIEWASRTVTQGTVLAAFAEHCRDELDDVTVVDVREAHLVARWRRETSRLELHGMIVPASLTSFRGEGDATMLIGDFSEQLDALAEEFASDMALRNRVALLDLARLEKVNAVRSSVFVYLEWFLRDAYGVKLLPAAAFTQRLIDRGVISLGFG